MDGTSLFPMLSYIYIALKDVKYVGGTVVRYQREQTRLRWAKLKDVLSEDDILGNKSVGYFQEKWEELLEKYNC